MNVPVVLVRRIAEDNPDLSYNAIKGIILGLEDVRLGHVREYDPESLGEIPSDITPL